MHADSDDRTKHHKYRRVSPWAHSFSLSLCFFLSFLAFISFIKTYLNFRDNLFLDQRSSETRMQMHLWTLH